MAIVINNTSSAITNVIVNNAAIDRIVANGVTVWQRVTFTSQDFDYTGDIQTFTVPCTGTYKLEVWGAEGGLAVTPAVRGYGGKGGYASGNLPLEKDTILYIVVGGKPPAATTWDGISYNRYLGGYNGGGEGSTQLADENHGEGSTGAGGGGATHIATASGILSDLETNKASVLIAAGGGGGGGALEVWDNQDDQSEYTVGTGGDGGGNTGSDGSSYGWNDGDQTKYPGPYNVGRGGTQTVGGDNGTTVGNFISKSDYISNHIYDNYEAIDSGFGQGGSILDKNAHGSAWTGNAGGGGGGYYGGGYGGYYCGGGGGSGYTGGLSDSSMENGVRTGNGFARITFVR